MCYHYELTAKAQQLENRFHASFDGETEEFIYANGFTHPKMPVITNEEPDRLQLYNWGLIPEWAKDSIQAKELANRCLNAKIETIEEKPAFKTSAIHKRCIIPATSFYEWKWLDSKGKEKEKYEIKLEDDDLFAFGGLWSNWTNHDNGEIIETFTIVTTTANPLMAEIHNTKKRMPLIFKISEINSWLQPSTDLELYSEITQHQHLRALLLESPNQTRLF